MGYAAGIHSMDRLAGHISFVYLLILCRKCMTSAMAASNPAIIPTDDRHTLLGPDVAFMRKENVPPAGHHARFVARMPDLAVEIQSPSNTLAELRRKAAVYLANGTELVWLVLPARTGVEVWRADAAGEPTSEFVARDGSVTGEPVLPGFTMELQKLFPD